MKKFGEFMAILLAAFIGTVINSFVLTKLWAWFIVPIFELNPLRLIEAMGILLIVTFITPKNTKKDGETWEKVLESFIFTITLALMTLGMGWIFSLIM